jgi:alkylation response protein AidB-like acyl-CoA dehydrogenase
VATLAWSGRRPATSALRADDGTITGVAEIVIDGSLAQTILVAAGVGDACGLFLVEADVAGLTAAGLTRTPLVALDSTRRLARLEFDGVPGELVAADAGAALERAMDVATLLLAAEQLGGAQRVLESAVEYARTRVQFGRYVGSFQAIKHRCADMLVDVELARSVVYHGLSRAQLDPATLPLEAALARSVVSEAFLHAAAANLQIHGGIGFTWEHSAHLYLKRAKSSALIFGDATVHRRRLAEQLGLVEQLGLAEPTTAQR